MPLVISLNEQHTCLYKVCEHIYKKHIEEPWERIDSSFTRARAWLLKTLCINILYSCYFINFYLIKYTVYFSFDFFSAYYSLCLCLNALRSSFILNIRKYAYIFIVRLRWL